MRSVGPLSDSVRRKKRRALAAREEWRERNNDPVIVVPSGGGCIRIYFEYVPAAVRPLVAID
jgi:hypothetical protein